MKITEYAVHRRLATIALLMALLVLGFYGLWGLPVNFLPDITYPMIRLHISWRGATPEEIETNVADPIERQMSTLDNLDSLESSSIEGMYTLRINFAYGVDVNIAYQDALEAMGRVARQLPADIDPPVMFKADPTQLPILQLTVRSDQWDLVRLRDWSENWLQDQLVAVPGVAGTEVIGGMKREIRVHLNPETLEKQQLSLPRIVQRLRDENIDQFGGRVTTGQREIIARTEGEFQNVDEIRDVVLARNGHAVVRLRDVAQVEDSHEEARVITRLDGEPCVKVSVLKQADANTVEVARAVERRIGQLEPLLPPGLELGIVESQADYVESALAGVSTTAIQAAILLIIVVYLFMGSWRQVMVMVIALPVTLVLNFGLMRLSGFSLNIFSLGGLVIAIGVLLSNTIVVVENITRWRATLPDLDKSQAVIGATSEVGTPILAATLTFLALFVPFLLVPGLTSLLFRELILVIAGIVATGASLGQTDRILQQIEDAVSGDELIDSIFTLAGGRVWGLYTYEIANEGELNIQLVPRGERDISTADFVARLRPVVAKIPVPGGMAMVNPMPLRGIRRLGDTDVEVRIRGQDLPTLFDLAGRTAATMNELDSLTNVNVSLDMNKPEYRARVDRARAAELGVSVRDVADTMRSMISGTVATRLREGEQLKLNTIIQSLPTPFPLVAADAHGIGARRSSSLPLGRPDHSSGLHFQNVLCVLGRVGVVGDHQHRAAA
ncbi:MAG: efflux RND transporter permease subunit, partial [Planctomycetaceae bacterium]